MALGEDDLVKGARIRIAASLASAPMGHLADTVAALEVAGADIIHFDLEDGTFVPMLTLGTRLIGELRPLTRLPFDAHLMVQNPERLIPEVVALGAGWVSVHWEACVDPHRALRLIRERGARAGLAFNPQTRLPDLRHLRSCLDFVLVLTSDPEHAQAAFLPETLAKLCLGRATLGCEGIDWVVDGGITAENAWQAGAAGATVIVSGRGVFRNGAVAHNLAALRLSASKATASRSCGQKLCRRSPEA